MFVFILIPATTKPLQKINGDNNDYGHRKNRRGGAAAKH